ncbi:hypothetical protein ERN12_16240 [Rhodobacteraceae bacterium]|nr:hypothetical protein ERN12_16240 [Paracoccaceae bacterium]
MTRETANTPPAAARKSPERRIILHIGTQKTGTTSIQDTCRRGREALRKHGVHYPALAPLTTHSILSVPFYGTGMPREFRHVFGEDVEHVRQIAFAYWAQIAQETHADRDIHTVVVSGEHLVDIVDHAGLKQHLAHLFPDWRIEVLCYLRDPAAYFLSHLRQQMRASGKLFWPHDFGWGEKLSGWQTIGEVRIREFSRKTLYKGDAVPDFLSQILPEPEIDTIPLQKPRNESLSVEAMELVRTYRAAIHPLRNDVLLPDSMRLISLLETAERLLPETHRPPKPSLTPLARDMALLHNHESMEILRDSFGFQYARVSLYDFDATAERLDKATQPDRRTPRLTDLVRFDRQAFAALRSELLALMLQGQEARTKTHASAPP